MAATDITSIIQTTNRTAGANVTDHVATADDTNGNLFTNDGKTLIMVQFAGSYTVTLYFPASALIDGQAPANHVLSLVTDKQYLIGPFPKSIYGNTVTFKANAAATVSLVSLGA